MMMIKQIFITLLLLLSLSLSASSQVVDTDTIEYWEVDLHLSNATPTYNFKAMDTEYIIVGTFFATLATLNTLSLIEQGREQEAIATGIILGSMSISLNIIGISNLIKSKRKRKRRIKRLDI